MTAATMVKTLLKRRHGVEEKETRYNLNQIQAFEMALGRQGRSLSEFHSILEFGCGYGRLTQYLFELAPEAKVFGCDICPDDIARCRRRYPQGHFIVNRAAPPLALADNLCDLIFSYSVFTHLSEANHKAWLRELARVLKPGGFMLQTTHSALALRLISLFSPERLSAYGLGTTVKEFLASDKEYHYVPYSSDRPEYGLSVMSREYVVRTWPEASGLALVDYVEGAIPAFPEGCQDLVLLVKRENSR